MAEGREALVRRLRELRRERARRDTEGVLVAEGLHLAQEALAAGAAIELAVVSPRLTHVAGGREILARLDHAGVEILELSDDRLARLQDARSPQPLLAIVRRRETSLVLGAGSPWVVAHGLQDPGNLGTLVRTALAAGARGIAITGAAVDPFHPRAVRATAGAVFRLSMHVIPAFAEAARTLRARGLSMVAADPAAPDRYDLRDWRDPFCLVVGSEGAGLPVEVDQLVDARVAIPLAREVDSLSVSAAAAIILFEAARQRGIPEFSGAKDE